MGGRSEPVFFRLVPGLIPFLNARQRWEAIRKGWSERDVHAGTSVFTHLFRSIGGIRSILVDRSGKSIYCDDSKASLSVNIWKDLAFSES